MKENSLDLLPPFNHNSTHLNCEMFPKTNEYEVLLMSYYPTCGAKEEASDEDHNSYCVFKKYYIFNTIAPEDEESASRQNTKFNLAVVISLSTIFGAIFAGCVAYTIYWKTRRGFYD